MVRKSNQAFLDPFFDVESDPGLQFGVRARLTARFAIDNVQSAGGSTHYGLGVSGTTQSSRRVGGTGATNKGAGDGER